MTADPKQVEYDTWTEWLEDMFSPETTVNQAVKEQQLSRITRRYALLLHKLIPASYEHDVALDKLREVFMWSKDAIRLGDD